MGRYVGGKLARVTKNNRAELLGDYYYYDFNGGPGEAGIYIEVSTANGYSGGNLKCAQQTFALLEGIDTPAFDIADAYISVSDSSGYSGGNLFCVEKTFQDLIDIA